MKIGVFQKSILIGFLSIMGIIVGVFITYQYIQSSILMSELMEFADSKINDLSETLAPKLYNVNFLEIRDLCTKFLDKGEIKPEIILKTEDLRKDNKLSSKIPPELESFTIEDLGANGYRIWDKDGVVSFITITNYNDLVLYDSQDKNKVDSEYKLNGFYATYKNLDVLHFKKHFVVKKEIYYTTPSLEKYLVGNAYIGISLLNYNQKKAKNTWFLIIILSLLAFIMMVFQVFYSRYSSQKIIRLKNAMKNLVDGSTKKLELDLKGSDEFGFMNEALYTVFERNENMFKFFSSASKEKLMKGKISLGGEIVNGTVLLIDIRDFTPFCENRDPKEVVKALNLIFTEIHKIISLHMGVIDKFIGDAVLSVFYERRDFNSSMAAVFCAHHINLMLKEFNLSFEQEFKKTLRVSMGINYGELISGSIGSQERMEFTVIGDTVNITARLQEEAKTSQKSNILISESVYERLDKIIKLDYFKEAQVKGRTARQKMYEVISIPELKEILMEDNFVQFELLQYYADKNTINYLLNKYINETRERRLEIISSFGELARIYPKEILEAYRTILNNENDDKILSRVISLISLCEKEVKLDDLKRFIPHENNRIYANAIETMAKFSDKETIINLKNAVNINIPRIKANAAISLIEKGYLKYLDTLFEMLNSKEEALVKSSIFAYSTVLYFDSVTKKKKKLIKKIKPVLDDIFPEADTKTKERIEKIYSAI